jgi:hypothetical protein
MLALINFLLKEMSMTQPLDHPGKHVFGARPDVDVTALGAQYRELYSSVANYLDKDANYVLAAKIFAVATSILTILDPVYGAAYGACYFTTIAVNVVADKFGMDQQDVIARVCRAGLATILSIGARSAVFSAFGASITVPVVVYVISAILIFSANMVLATHPSKTTV